VVGSRDTRLIILRGNSASGKTTIAHELRKRLPEFQIAIVSQDVIRRDVLRDRADPGASNIELIDIIVRFSLDHGYHVVLEGILHTPTYSEMLCRLVADHSGLTRSYFVDVPFDETLKRHATKATANAYGEVEMRRWYIPNDRLDCLCETTIPASSTLDESVSLILGEADFESEREGN
jgi:adenylylsulfate kinase-like enzyme